MYYTRHAQEQFSKRFPQLQTDKTVLISLHNCFQTAERSKRLKNNTAYLSYLYDRYGPYDYEFWVNGPCLFVAKDGTVITVMDRDDPNSMAHKIHGRSKHSFSSRNIKP